MYPQHFKRVNVIDVGSLDINGHNRGLFSRCHYIGIDVHDGYNVDIVGRAHAVMADLEPKDGLIDVTWNPHHTRIETNGKFDTIISTEALEHDCYLHLTLVGMYNKLRPGGLLLITCAGDGRKEHGTTANRPEDSPGTNDYYSNVSNRMFSSILPPALFKVYHLKQVDTDLQFYGIKN